MYRMTLDLSYFYMQVPSLFLVCFWRLKVPNSLFLASALKLRMKPFQWLCRRVNPTSSIGQNRLTKWCLTPRLLVSFWYMHIRWMYKVCARTNLALSIFCSGIVQLNIKKDLQSTTMYNDPKSTPPLKMRKIVKRNRRKEQLAWRNRANKFPSIARLVI